MGLAFTHCAAHWSYSGFHRFRQRLAREIGLDLDAMVGFAENGQGRSWIEVPPDPIVWLLNHSDCDGDLTPDQCKTLGPRLLELVARWPDIDHDTVNARMLAKGMKQAADHGVPLRFG